MSAVLIQALRDLRRRPLQAAVVFLTALLAVGTGTMALTLISQTGDSYQSAFDAQRGAHLQASFLGSTDPQLVAATPTWIDAAGSSGLYRATDLLFKFGSHKLSVRAVGRDDPDSPVDQLQVTAGRWPAKDSEIALTRSFAEQNQIAVGDRIRVVSVRSEPLLTVTAEVFDIDQASAAVSPQDAWVQDTAIAGLQVPDSSYYVVNYRFATAPTSARIRAALATLRQGLPAGSLTGSSDYNSIRSVYGITNQLPIALLLAFSIFALLATIAIVANLVTGIVISSYRQIGILKAVGFTPLQVNAVMVLQVLIPTALAALVAIPLGSLGSQPLLSASSLALGIAYRPAFSPSLDALALAGALVIVGFTALLPASRAGRLKAAAVISNASAPQGLSGRWLRRLCGWLRLPRPIVLGAGDAFARPLRATLTIVAILVGVTTVTVAVGFPRSLSVVTAHELSIGYADVVAQRSPALADPKALGIITSDPQTAAVVSELDENVAVRGVSDPVAARVYRGDSSRLGFMLAEGRWFRGPGEALAPRKLITEAHLRLGDRFTMEIGSQSVPLVLVGNVYDASNLGNTLFFDWSTISQSQPDRTPSTYWITLTPGANLDGYVRRVGAAEPDLLDVRRNSSSLSGVQIEIVLLIVAVVVIVIGAAGVFNTMLLSARERIRDTATLRAIGMSPGQVMIAVAAAAAILALVGAGLGVPAGWALNRALMTLIDGVAPGGNDTPALIYDVYGAWELLGFGVAAVVTAAGAALIPGRWAARASVIDALHEE